MTMHPARKATTSRPIKRALVMNNGPFDSAREKEVDRCPILLRHWGKASRWETLTAGCPGCGFTSRRGAIRRAAVGPEHPLHTLCLTSWISQPNTRIAHEQTNTCAGANADCALSHSFGDSLDSWVGPSRLPPVKPSA